MPGSVRNLTLGLSIAAAGCLGPKHATYESARTVSVNESAPEADALWEAIQETLRRHRYRLDRIDRSAGVITTFPVGSEHFFEFWRHDVDTRADFIEATLNPVRRWVEITLSPAADDASRQLQVQVHKQRLSAPDRQFTSSAAAYQFFAASLPTTTGEMTADTGEVWLDLGRDPAMENRLLSAILKRAGLDPS